jgi:hypothetical protein
MKVRTAFQAILVLLAAAVTVAAAVVAWMVLGPRRVPAGQPPLTILEAGSLPAFREVFNASDGEVRVLALLSPT